MEPLGSIFKNLRRQKKDETPTSECLDAKNLAAYIDGNLSASDRQLLDRHLIVCQRCFEDLGRGVMYIETLPREIEPLPRHVFERAMETVRPRPEKSTFGEVRYSLDLAIRFVKDSLELLSTSGHLALAPVPIAVRGATQEATTPLLTVEDALGETKVSVEVERVGADNVQATIELKDQAGAPLETIRATLLSDGREMASYISRQGRVVFKDIVPGEYDLVFSKAGGSIGTVRLRIEAGL